MKKAGFNVIDWHFYLQAQTQRRNCDGIHWSPAVNRLMTHLTLTHLTITLSGPGALPGRLKRSTTLNRQIQSRGLKRKWRYKHLGELCEAAQYLSPEFSSQVDEAVVRQENSSRDPEWTPAVWAKQY